ncbi:MAG TPA: gliding motility-associated C-terminal domain-containing protein [Puia sp.]|nr:gliding motility-associated C-terminal domain-containing protein [Puia sp.]
MAGRVALAQTCAGGLGDPIVNITFGQAVGAGPALPPGVTTMTYQAADCPPDGSYTITGHTSSCFGNTWWSVGQDHTGNQAGLFMLVNASYQPSDFYVQQVSGLCAGTSYQFAAWIMNMVAKPGLILPNITFRIEKTDGTVLQTFATGDIPQTTGGPEWVQYAFYFTTPPGVSTVVLRMTNNAPGGNGNDIGLDDITFRAAGPSVMAGITGYPADTVSICADVQPLLSLGATVESCYPSQVQQWQQSTDGGTTWADIPGATGNSWSRAPSVPGNYLYRLEVAQSGNLGNSTCQVVSPPIAIDILAMPSPAVTIADSSATACEGFPVKFIATPVDGGGNPSYQWTVNGSPAGNGTSIFSSVFSPGNDVIACTMKSDAACVIDPLAQSNVLPLNIVAIPPTAVAIAASAIQICADSLVTFTATPVNGGAAPVFQWLVNGLNAGPSGGSPVFTDPALQNGDVVNCIMTGSLTCSQPVAAVTPISMTVYPLPQVALDTAVIIAGGSGIRLQPAITGDIAAMNWTPSEGLSDPTIASPVAAPAVTTAYTLNVVTVDGCRASATEMVKVFYDLKMPAAFTPNGDGHNDLFRVPPSVPLILHRLTVYNRQGGMVFETQNIGGGWDGTFGGQLQPAGVYVWTIEYQNPVTKLVETQKGTVILVR